MYFSNFHFWADDFLFYRFLLIFISESVISDYIIAISISYYSKIGYIRFRYIRFCYINFPFWVISDSVTSDSVMSISVISKSLHPPLLRRRRLLDGGEREGGARSKQGDTPLSFPARVSVHRGSPSRTPDRYEYSRPPASPFSLYPSPYNSISWCTV